MCYKIRNTNNRGDSVLLSPAFATKKGAWLRAVKMAQEEAQDILYILESDEERNALRLITKGQITVKATKYFDGEKNYESTYTVERVDVC